ncbi:MAG: hypothetical protein LBL31_08650 [Spirochaetaceae bacterium]|jgi:hypothetical protein|nr:hypothetical protein [Spirochaetaceae bacterium]
MKKIVVLSAVLFTAFTFETHAFGFGVQGGLNVMERLGGFSFLISPNQQTHGSITWLTGTSEENSGITLAGALDYWLLSVNLTALGPGALNFFLGGGAYARIEAWEEHFGAGAGLRVPFGLDWDVTRFDVFVQIAPLFGLRFLPSPGFDGFDVDVNIGARIWIG